MNKTENPQRKKAIDSVIGKRFGRLTAKEWVSTNSRRQFVWKCLCDCGQVALVASSNLRTGVSRSCGCLQREISRAAGDRTRTHSKSGTSIYSIWGSMVRRCHAPNAKDYYRYGAIGIKVCDQWRTFDGFYTDMGDRPEGMSIDRIDNTKGYEPLNCRWATNTTQQRNKSNNLILDFDGKSMCLSGWSEVLGINEQTLYARLKNGWTVDRAFTQPVASIYSHKKNIRRKRS